MHFFSLRFKILASTFVFLGILLTYLLWPLSSEKFAIRYDQAKIRFKKDFLNTVVPASFDEKKRPNIIIITADDLGKTDISLYGSPHVKTPHLDSLGFRGAVFTEGYVTSPICSPSRAGMLTGRYQQRFGYEVQPQRRYPHNRLEYYTFRYLMDIGDWVVSEQMSVPKQKDINKQGLPPSEITLAEILKKNHYRTAIMGKWHLGEQMEFLPNQRGFDEQYGFYEAFSLYSPLDASGIVNQRLNEFTDDYIWDQGRKGPCAIRRNHEVVAEKEYLSFGIAREANQFLEQNCAMPFFLYVPFNAPHTPFQAPQEYYDRFAHVEDKAKRIYYAMIAALDDAVGQILEKVRELGIEENTLICFASDNGGAVYTGATDNAPLKGGKFANFEGGINVPFMMQWKGVIPQGTVFEHPVSVLDFFATAVEVSSSELPQDRIYDGINLIPYLTGNKTGAPHQALYWKSGYNEAIRKNQWKLILNHRDQTVLLYDVVQDKIEQKNLANQYPQIVKELSHTLNAWKKDLASPLWPSVMHYRFVIGQETYFFAL